MQRNASCWRLVHQLLLDTMLDEQSARYWRLVDGYLMERLLVGRNSWFPKLAG